MTSKHIPRFYYLMSWTILGLVVLAFCFGLLVPIYSDEVAVHMSKARFFLEGGQLINLTPQCNISTTAQVPLTWYPAAIFYGGLYALPGGIGLRLTGIGLGLTYLSLLWIWVGKLCLDSKLKNNFRTLIIAINGLGVLPLVLILARSEQCLVLSLLLLCLFSIFWCTDETDGGGVKALKICAFLLLISVFYYAHPKSFFFSPFIVISAFYIFRKENLYVRTAIFGVIGLAAYQVLQQAQALDCLGAPILSKILSGVTINFQLLSTNPVWFFEIGANNILSLPGAIAGKLVFATSYQSAWLPGLDELRIGGGVLFLNFLIKSSVILGGAWLLGMLIFQLVQQLSRRQINQEIALASGLFAGLLVHGFIYNGNSWHFYTPGLIVPIFAMIFLLVAPGSLKFTDFGERIWCYVSYYWAGLSLASIVCIGLLIFPPLLKIAREAEYISPKQPLSTPVLLVENKKTDLLMLAKNCGVNPNNSKRLVLDGAAYFEFKNQKEPINILYVSEFGFGADIASQTKKFLNKINSDGVISRCDYLPKALKEDAIRDGDMCCVAKSKWQQ